MYATPHSVAYLDTSSEILSCCMQLRKYGAVNSFPPKQSLRMERLCSNLHLSQLSKTQHRYPHWGLVWAIFPTVVSTFGHWVHPPLRDVIFRWLGHLNAILFQFSNEKNGGNDFVSGGRVGEEGPWCLPRGSVCCAGWQETHGGSTDQRKVYINQFDHMKPQISSNATGRS